MRKKTKIAIVLDRSGSMKKVRAETIKGYNEQIQSIREEASNLDSGETTVSLIIFDSTVMPNYFERSINFLTDIRSEDYDPDKGWTRMYDAVGYTIERLLKETSSDDPDTAYLVVIISDGQENPGPGAQTKYNAKSLAELIKKVQATKRWTFTYLGANQDLGQVQDTLGFEASNMAKWSNRGGAASVLAMRENTKSVQKYMKARQQGQTQVTNLFSDKNQIADFGSEKDRTAEIVSDIRNMIDNSKGKKK